MKPGTGKTYKYVWTARNFIKFEEKNAQTTYFKDIVGNHEVDFSRLHVYYQSKIY